MVSWTSAAPREDSTMDEIAATLAASKWGGMIRHDSYRAVDRPRVRAVFTSSRGRWRPGRAFEFRYLQNVNWEVPTKARRPPATTGWLCPLQQPAERLRW
jgi:hypothetical protein